MTSTGGPGPPRKKNASHNTRTEEKPTAPYLATVQPPPLRLKPELFDNSSNSLFTKNRGIGTILNDD